MQNKELQWTSANPSVATVDASGRVKARGTGITTITVSALDGSEVLLRRGGKAFQNPDYVI
ncbi:Ig-like domain-containing protein [Lachnospiraceae bacterium KK002]